MIASHGSDIDEPICICICLWTNVRLVGAWCFKLIWLRFAKRMKRTIAWLLNAHPITIYLSFSHSHLMLLSMVNVAIHMHDCVSMRFDAFLVFINNNWTLHWIRSIQTYYKIALKLRFKYSAHFLKSIQNKFFENYFSSFFWKTERIFLFNWSLFYSWKSAFPFQNFCIIFWINLE